MTSQKPGLHPRNRHRSRYDMNALCLSCPPLKDYIVQTPAGEPSVNFADPQAVKMLNKRAKAKDFQVALTEARNDANAASEDDNRQICDDVRNYYSK